MLVVLPSDAILISTPHQSTQLLPLSRAAKPSAAVAAPSPRAARPGGAGGAAGAAAAARPRPPLPRCCRRLSRAQGTDPASKPRARPPSLHVGPQPPPRQPAVGTCQGAGREAPQPAGRPSASFRGRSVCSEAPGTSPGRRLSVSMGLPCPSVKAAGKRLHAARERSGPTSPRQRGQQRPPVRARRVAALRPAARARGRLREPGGGGGLPARAHQAHREQQQRVPKHGAALA